MSEILVETQISQIKSSTDSKQELNDSFNKVFSLQKLIHKQAGLKRLCKKKILIKFLL